MKKIIVLLICYIFITSCASTSTQGEKVIITSNPEKIEGCQFIGQIESSSILVRLTANGVAYNHARNELKNEARRKGANVVLTSRNSDTIAEAYECKDIEDP
ncbi:MAG: DUF4156 domain-containing protein [Desulfobacterales bacterium]|jgi:hypothetical protein